VVALTGGYRGFEVGARVTVSALDYGVDPVPGALVGLSFTS